MSFLRTAYRLIYDSLVKLGHVFLVPFEVVREIEFKAVFAPKLSPRKKNAKPKSAAAVKEQKTPRSSFTWFFLGVTLSFVFLFAPYYSYQWYKKIPQPRLIDYQTIAPPTRILDREGRLLFELYTEQNHVYVSLYELPAHVRDATLAIEDSTFYSHYGFRPERILRAAYLNLTTNTLQGASTITQQLAKNLLLTPERTFERKAQELVLAVLIERDYTKDQIFEMYLNNISYGGNTYGIGAAAEKYFNKPAAELTLSEASLLAGLPSAPTLYSPLNGGFDLARARQFKVLSRMAELGYISQQAADEAFIEKLTFVSEPSVIRAPHFVEYVRAELYSMFGRRMVDRGGLTVITSLDLVLHEAVQAIIASEVKRNSYLGFSNGAAIVLAPETGEILAYAGSAGYFDHSGGKFDVLTALRQPGSSVKPITYALAFEQGLTDDVLVNDAPVTYRIQNELYTPRNYDNQFRGQVTLRESLASSYNIPAVKVVNFVGLRSMVDLGRAMGLKSWDFPDSAYGMSVTLGAKEAPLVELSNVYATFARHGIYKSTTPFISIRDVYGFEIYSKDTKETRVITERTARLITDILSDNSARAPGFGPNSLLVVPGRRVAVKTGTTDNIRDNLTVGYDNNFVVGVWVGNNDNTPMNRQLSSGLTGAAPIWNKIFRTLYNPEYKP